MKVCVVGLGYVGLPLATELSKAGFETVGFDIDESKVRIALDKDLHSSTDPRIILGSHVVIVCVPTPVTRSKSWGWPEPDIGAIVSAARTVGQNMSPGAVVVLESTVSPGMTRNVFIPELERASGKMCGEDFFVGYSPEEINPGDDSKAVHSISKLIASDSPKTVEVIRSVYGALTDVLVVPSIEVAEAAKVVENIQRDVLLALNNELAFSLRLFGITASDVFAAAAHKWNYVHLKPGLVGGHCIPVDPWYYMDSAIQNGAGYFDIQMIDSARHVNDMVPYKLASLVTRLAGSIGGSVLIKGYTYKPDVPDIRETGSLELAKALERHGYTVSISDPLVPDKIPPKYADKGAPYDVVIIAVDHSNYHDPDEITSLGMALKPGGLLVDVQGTYKSVQLNLGAEYVCL